MIAVDTNRAALERDRLLGAGTVALVDASVEANVTGLIREVTDGGVHVSIDAFRSPETAVASVGSRRRCDWCVQAGLLLGPNSTPPTPMDRVIARELQIYGSHGMPPRDHPAMLAMIKEAPSDRPTWSVRSSAWRKPARLWRTCAGQGTQA